MNDLKNLDLSESFENKETFRLQCKENQRFDLLELTSDIQQITANIYKRSKYLENKIDTIRDTELLNSHIVNSLDYFDLSRNISTLYKRFARLNSFMEIYLTNKKDEQ